MHIPTVFAAAALTMTLLGANAAFADAGSTSCAQFTRLSPAHQERLVSDLTSDNSGLASAINAKTGRHRDDASNNAATDAGAGVPDAGAIASACEATPNATLHDMLSIPGAVTGGANASE